jgi:hypothetical protein
MKRLLVIFVLFVLISLFSCKKEENVGLLTQNAKTRLENLAPEIEKRLNNVNSTKAVLNYQTFSAIVSKSDPFGSVKGMNNTSNLLNSIEVFSNYKSLINSGQSKSGNNQPFDFKSHVGTYTWNISKQTWDINKSNPADKIVINFPSDGSPVNNAILTVLNYEESKIILTDNTFQYQPSALKASLFVDNEEQLTINLTASYSSESIPVKLNLQLFLKPFDMVLDLTTSSKTITLNYQLSKDKENLFSANILLTFFDSSRKIPSGFNSTFQCLDIKFDAAGNILGLAGLYLMKTQKDAEDMLNSYFPMSLTMMPENKKIGDVKMVFDTNQQIQFMIEFPDKTTEKADTYFKPIMAEIQKYFNVVELPGLTILK